MTFSQAWSLFDSLRKGYVAESTSQGVDKFAKNNLLKVLGDRELESYTTVDILQFVQSQLAYRKPSGVNMHLRSLKVFGRFLAKHKLASADNPFATLEFIRVRDKQIRYLSEDEFKRIWQTETIPEYRFMFLIALLTALRLSDILALKFSQIDFRNWTLLIVQQKTQRRLTIPVHPELREPFLHAQIAAKGRDSVWERQRTVGAVSHHFTKVAVRAKVYGISFHGLRRTCASWLVQKGVPILNVSTLLGHSSVVLTQKMYGSLAPSNLQADVLHLPIPTGSIPLKTR